jgi:CHASE3 domain sensor protein
MSDQGSAFVRLLQQIVLKCDDSSSEEDEIESLNATINDQSSLFLSIERHLIIFVLILGVINMLAILALAINVI